MLFCFKVLPKKCNGKLLPDDCEIILHKNGSGNRCGILFKFGFKVIDLLKSPSCGGKFTSKVKTREFSEITRVFNICFAVSVSFYSVCL